MHSVGCNSLYIQVHSLGSLLAYNALGLVQGPTAAPALSYQHEKFAPLFTCHVCTPSGANKTSLLSGLQNQGVVYLIPTYLLLDG